MSKAAEPRSPVRSIVSELWRDGRGMILLSVSLTWFMAIGVRITYPALLPQMMEDFQFTFTTAGFVLSGMWIAYALLQFPGGMLADMIGERRTIALSMGITTASVIAVIAAPTFAPFVIATILIGIGTGLFGTTRITILSDIYRDAASTAISFSQAAGNLGNMLLPVGAGIISAFFGWRYGIGYLLPIFVVVLLSTWYFVPHRTSSGVAIERENLRSFSGAILEAILLERVMLASIVLCCLLFLYQGVTGFLPAYLIEMKGFGNAQAATAFGFFFFSAIVLQFVSGIVADLYGARVTIITFSLLSIPAYVVFPFVDGTIGILVVIFLLAAALGAIPPAHTFAVRLLPETVQGSGYGLIRTGFILIGATSPPLIGFLADRGQFDLAFPALGAVILGAGIVTLVLLFGEYPVGDQ